MEEAERLCDRLAVIDTGRVVALDTPAGIVAKAAPEQVIRFRPSGPLDDARLTALLTALPQVTAVRRTGGRVEVTGRGDLLQAVTALLAREQIIAAELRVDQSGLDEAFVALTGHHPRPAEPAHAKTSKESR
jgi:ABC-2 type transport system ATP-binding protein